MQVMIQFRTFIVSCVCMLTALVIVQRIHSGSNVEVIEQNMDKFPYKIGDYIGIDIPMEASVIKELNTDVSVFRRYVNEQGERITLYIGYYGTKKGGRTGHSPGGCYPGSGWAILDETDVEVPVDLNGNEKMIPLNALQVTKGVVRECVYHWYQSNGDKVLSSGIAQNFHRFKGKILYNRNDGAFIRVSVSVTQSLSYTKNKLKSFVKEIYPLIVKYWPEEREV